MSIVAKRYAEALFQLAEERGRLDAIQEELELVAGALRDEETLLHMLDHPQINVEKKKESLFAVFAPHLSEMTSHFLGLLIDKGRQGELFAIVGEYVSLANASRGVSVGTAVTAIPLTAAEHARLEQLFEAKIGQKVQLESRVDPGVKGGVFVRLADRIYDGSVSGKLTRFQKRLKTV